MPTGVVLSTASKDFGAQSAAGNNLAADGASQFACGTVSPRANSDRSTGASQGKRGGAGRSPGAENQHAAFRQD